MTTIMTNLSEEQLKDFIGEYEVERLKRLQKLKHTSLKNKRSKKCQYQIYLR